MIRERTQASLVAARPRGRNGGRTLKLSDNKQQVLYDLYSAKEKSIREIYEAMVPSKKTLYEYLERRLPPQ